VEIKNDVTLRCRARRPLENLVVLCVLCFLQTSCGEVQQLGTEGVVMQQHEWDCGVAALKMILDHHGIRTTYNDLLHRFETGPRTGVSMLTLKRLSESEGLRCAGWRLAAADLRGIPLPAILLLRRGHFVVLHSVSTAGEILLLDPARGRLRITARKLHSLWEGETLLFYSPGSIPDGFQYWFGPSLSKERNNRT
jgi:ABC-type bacteriocin/lantibiotic exporter with double-glycine peptidase domain